MLESSALGATTGRKVTPNISSGPADMAGDGRLQGKARLDISQDVIERASAGDKDAFGSIYRTFYPAIFRLARLHLGDAAEDAAAETFLRAWKALPRFKRTAAPFSAWLYAIARHVVVDEVRRRARVEPRDALPEQPVAPPDVDRIALSRVIERLPDEQRKVIEMKYLLQMKNPEVAAVLDKSVGAVNALQWRALNSLRDLLTEDEAR